MPTDTCHPSQMELTAFARGEPLGVERLDEIVAHLAECARCQQAVAQVEPDPFVAAIEASSAAGDPAAGRRIVEGYELFETLGAGGAGVVYRARQPGLEREVALKVLRSGGAASETELQRWRRETRTLGALNHPHIVKIFDAGEQEGTPFIAMELVAGSTLAEHLRKGPLSATEAATLVRDLADAMAYAHARSIVHRDLKPGNVLIPVNGQLRTCKIADFGLSRWLEEESQTRTGDALGTPSYMSPEQVRGEHDRIGPATDVYGLGSILYECLTGRPPFQGASAVETMQLVLDRDAAPISRHRAAVPQDLDAICVRCLEKDPALRYSTADGLCDDLTRFLAGKPVVARKPSRWRLTRMWVSRNPWLASFAALLLAAMILGVGALLWHQRSLREQRETAHRHYAEARATIWEMLAVAKSRSALDIPKLGEMALRQAEEALDLFERLAEEEDSEASQSELARIRLDLGTLYLTQGDDERGRHQLQLAVDAITQLPSADSLERLSEALTGHVKLANALINQQRYDEAATFLVNAREMGIRLLQVQPHHVPWMNHVAWVDHTEGNRQWHQDRLPEARSAYEKAVELRARGIELDPDNTELAQLLIESRLSLAQCRTQLGELSEAREMMEQAIREIDQLNAATRPELTRQVARGTALLNLSNILAALETAEQAAGACQEGIDSLQAFFAAEPNNAAVRQTLFQLHGNCGMYRMSAEQPAAGLTHWEKAIQLAPNEELATYCQTMQIRCFILADQLPEAMAAAETLETQSLSADNIFRLAAAWGALASQLDTDQAGRKRQAAIRSVRALARLDKMEPLEGASRHELLATSDDFAAARLLLLPVRTR